MPRLFDTAARRVLELDANPGKPFGMYICGPTVYGPPHIGHGRAVLVPDVLRRYLEWSGVVVRHVSNITDIDDKIIERARAEDRPWQSVATECEEQWWAVMHDLGVQRPEVAPHATEYVEQMVELIDELLSSSHAYRTSDGVYLSSETVSDYGTLSGQSLEQLRSGARVEVAEEKRSPVDFALWKAAKQGEPSWSSPFGAGRPGWHTECVVMSLALLGGGFDLHGGGQDLIFPHHENERAQAHALGRHFARHWFHHGFITSSGEKMSKSLGNTTSLADVLERYDARAYRLLVLQSHYRQPLEVADQALADATSALRRIDALARRFEDASALAETPPGAALRARFRGSMDDDLDTPSAIGALFEALREANAAYDRGERQEAAALGRVVLECFEVVGIASSRAESVPEDVLLIARERDTARASGEYARADALRDELEAAGWRVEDSPQGTRVHR